MSKNISIQTINKELEKQLNILDHLFQDGTVFLIDDVKRFDFLIEKLKEIRNDREFQILPF